MQYEYDEYKITITLTIYGSDEIMLNCGHPFSHEFVQSMNYSIFIILLIGIIYSLSYDY